MPTLRRKSRAADPAKIYQCIESHFGGDAFFRSGVRLRGDRIVPFSAGYWIEDGGDESDIARAREELHAEPEPPPTVPPEKPKKRVRAVKAFSVAVPVPIAGTNLLTGQNGLRVVSVGDEFDADDPLVRQHRDSFEKV